MHVEKQITTGCIYTNIITSIDAYLYTHAQVNVFTSLFSVCDCVCVCVCALTSMYIYVPVQALPRDIKRVYASD